MDGHKKKMVAPIVITAIVTLYYTLYFGILIWLLEGVWKYALGLIPLALVGIMVYVCAQRISEIRKGEEDDIGKY